MVRANESIRSENPVLLRAHAKSQCIAVTSSYTLQNVSREGQRTKECVSPCLVLSLSRDPQQGAVLFEMIRKFLSASEAVCEEWRQGGRPTSTSYTAYRAPNHNPGKSQNWGECPVRRGLALDSRESTVCPNAICLSFPTISRPRCGRSLRRHRPRMTRQAAARQPRSLPRSPSLSGGSASVQRPRWGRTPTSQRP